MCVAWVRRSGLQREQYVFRQVRDMYKLTSSLLYLFPSHCSTLLTFALLQIAQPVVIWIKTTPQPRRKGTAAVFSGKKSLGGVLWASTTGEPQTSPVGLWLQHQRHENWPSRAALAAVEPTELALPFWASTVGWNASCRCLLHYEQVCSPLFRTQRRKQSVRVPSSRPKVCSREATVELPFIDVVTLVH